ncbi:MAG: PA2169 family four-helix-bundle protein [Flavobacterium sp. JAD_PAG50586_2]|nr:MAG: PA2169 family four-helix-bundle protein [Flavobacterium sp. JAD_PAG50586_2]
MKTEKTIYALNELVTINNDRIEGYKTAYDETEEQDLKTLFLDFIRTSQKCKTELEDNINRLGGKVAEGTMITGKFFRVWMDVKAALTGKDRKVILDSCEFGEDAAVKAYKHALTEHLEDLTPEQQNLIRSQYATIKADHDKVKAMRDALVTS